MKAIKIILLALIFASCGLDEEVEPYKEPLCKCPDPVEDIDDVNL